MVSAPLSSLTIAFVNRENNKYICVSGNTGVGKSTLLKTLGQSIYGKDNHTIVVDEKSIHHPFLTSLFNEPHLYGFQVELNFLVQRSLLAKKWLASGYNLIMERSIFDDKIFVEHFFNEGIINKQEYDSYLQLWQSISKKVPMPNAMILVDFPPDFSMTNLTKDEFFGIRPREFPDEETKKHWITSWFKLYTKFFAEITNNNLGIKIFTYNSESNLSELLNEILNF